MKRVNIPEILDTDACPPGEVQTSLQDIGRVNRWFGGIATTKALIERVARATERKHFSLLEVAAGSGEVPELVAQGLAKQGITLDITLTDRSRSHLPRNRPGAAADALALPFREGAFDLVSCNLFAHHLEPDELAQFAGEAIRVSRCALLINDLVRHPLHLALVYAGFPMMRSRVSRLDGVASVRRAYVPQEIREIVSSASGAGSGAGVEIFRHCLFRMGIIVWK
jgi:hypothetical protein